MFMSIYLCQYISFYNLKNRKYTRINLLTLQSIFTNLHLEYKIFQPYTPDFTLSLSRLSIPFSLSAISTRNRSPSPRGDASRNFPKTRRRAAAPKSQNSFERGAGAQSGLSAGTKLSPLRAGARRRNKKKARAKAARQGN